MSVAVFNAIMSGSSEKYYLLAVVADIRAIRGFVSALDLTGYISDLKTRYATERALLNISEAVRNLEKHGRSTDPRFSLSSISTDIEWAKIKGIGNVLRHDYETVSPERVWAVIENHLDDLERACWRALQQT